MFTQEEIVKIQKLLQEGVTPEEIAVQLEISRTALNSKLLRSGYNIEITRSLALVNAVPMPAINLLPNPEKVEA
jgi:biotin operon repressor